MDLTIIKDLIRELGSRATALLDERRGTEWMSTRTAELVTERSADRTYTHLSVDKLRQDAEREAMSEYRIVRQQDATAFTQARDTAARVLATLQADARRIPLSLRRSRRAKRPA